MKTWSAKPNEVNPNWFLVDATDKTVGRLASEIAKVLRGKNKPTFTPHVDTGDFVVVVNSEKVKFTGNKWTVKKYYSHSRFFGSLKEITAEKLREKDPAQILTFAIQGMLPKTKLGRKMITKLKVYKGSTHPHGAQKPVARSERLINE